MHPLLSKEYGKVGTIYSIGKFFIIILSKKSVIRLHLEG